MAKLHVFKREHKLSFDHWDFVGAFDSHQIDKTLESPEAVEALGGPGEYEVIAAWSDAADGDYAQRYQVSVPAPTTPVAEVTRL